MEDVLAIVRDFEVNNPELFFTAVCEVYETVEGSDDTSFDSFKTEFLDRAGRDGFAEAGEEFVKYADGNGGLDVARQVHSTGASALLAEYEAFIGEAEEEAEEADDSYDEEAWKAFLAEHGPEWNGDEEAWPAFKDWFTYHAEEQGFLTPATEFLEYADGADDKVAVFAEYGVTITAGEDDETEADPEAWNAFLAEYGTGWNGDEEAWPAFKDWFLHYAEEQGLTGPATDFLEYAEGADDKVAVFAEYGITITAADQASGEAETEADPEAWNAFLAEYGTGWNGEEETWEAFKDWFLHYAEERGLTTTATGFIDYAEGESDRIAFFAQYGVTIAAAAADEGEEALESIAALFDEEAVAAAQQKFEDLATASDAVPDEHQATMTEAFAEVLKQMPEAAGLSEEEIQQLIAEVATEHL